MKKQILLIVVILCFAVCANAQYVYYISSGEFHFGDGTRAKGYSGYNYNSDGWNYQNQTGGTGTKNSGAIPPGTYYIKNVTSSKGPLTIVLESDRNNNMSGRGDFRIHGDTSDSNASRGCIILNYDARSKIANAHENRGSSWLTLYVYE
jgi:hypothetical protein